MMSASNDTAQMPVIVSDKTELRNCIMHLWPTYNGLGLNLKNSKKDGQSPHVVRNVDENSPAHYAGVLSNDLVVKVGNKVVEFERFDNVLKLIKEQLKKDKRVDLLLVNTVYYAEFRQKNEAITNGRKIDYNSSLLRAQIKYYQSPLQDPNSSVTLSNKPPIKTQSVCNLLFSPVSPVTELAYVEARLCHLLTWSNYDGYGFCAAYNNDGVFVKNVEPNSPAQLGGMRDYDRIVEINGKHVHAKDKETISKLIAKHKIGGAGLKGSVNTLKSQSAYSVASHSKKNEEK